MEISIRLVLVAVVALVVAGVAIFMVKGEANSFSEFMSGTTTKQKCNYWADQATSDSCSKFRNNECGQKVDKTCSSDSGESSSGTQSDRDTLNQDSDGDGVPEYKDDYPDDSSRS